MTVALASDPEARALHLINGGLFFDIYCRNEIPRDRLWLK